MPRHTPAAIFRPLLVSATFVFLAVGAGAQERRPIWPGPPIIWPPRPVPQREQEIDLQKQQAVVKVAGTVAQIRLTQEFVNTRDRQVEGTYLFPIPANAAVGGFAMTVDGKRLEGEVLEGEKARGIYEDIVRRLRDPGILEFAGQDVLKARIFPIAARATVTVEIAYTTTLKIDGAGYRLVVPQRLPIGGAAESSSVQVEFADPDIKAVYSPTHPIQVTRGAGGTKASGEWNAQTLDSKDFVLLFTSGRGRVGLDVTVYRREGEDPYFLLLAAPDANLGKKEVAAKDVVFVFDTSGSMEGEKIQQARKALLSLLGNLNPGDRFNVLTFSSDVRPFRDNLVAASPANIGAAREFVQDIKAIGGTAIDDAVAAGLKNFAKDEVRPRQMVFLTDGQPTVGETRTENILQNTHIKNAADVRLFVFGVGNDVNTQLLDSLAEENRGSSDYVTPKEDIEQKVGSLYQKIAYPVLTNPTLNWTGTSAYDVYPPKLPDLFLGTQAVVFGRLRGTDLPKVSLAGEAAGMKETVTGDVAAGGDADNQIPRLWAVRKVGYLLDDARRNGRPIPEEVKDEIVQLSKKFGLITPLTAGLVTEDSPVGTLDRHVARSALSPSDLAAMNGAAPMDLFKAAAPEAPRSGAGAVAGALALRSLRESEQLDAPMQGLRTAGGKTFAYRDGIWTDLSYDEKARLPKQTVRFASQEYFELARDPRCAAWLSLGDNVLFVWQGKVIAVTP